MTSTQPDSNGAARVAFILVVPLADNVVRQWPQGRVLHAQNPASMRR